MVDCLGAGFAQCLGRVGEVDRLVLSEIEMRMLPISVDSTIVLSTGKELDVPGGVVGINHKGDVCGGYDESFILPDDEWMIEEFTLTPQECVELADIMLSRWNAFRERFK